MRLLDYNYFGATLEPGVAELAFLVGIENFTPTARP